MKLRYLMTALSILLLSGCSPAPSHGPQPEEPFPSVPSLSEEERFLYDCIDQTLFEEQKLPARTCQGSPITWEVLSGSAELRDGQLFRTEDAEEYTIISLKASTPESEAVFDHLTLTGPAVASLITYFTSDGQDREQLKLAYTYNGTYWFKVNNDRGILKPSKGTGRLRDPALVRKPGGGFSLLATQGYDTDSIYVFDTDDLVHYENERLLRLNDSEDGSMSRKQAWAPEAFYDNLLDTYVILWSSPEDGGVFATASQDLHECSFPLRFFDPGFPIIDITLAHTSNGRTAIFKDEREPMETYSVLLRAGGPCWYELEAESDPVFPRHQLEGPMLIKSPEKPGWFLYADDYTRSSYLPLYADSLETGSFRELEEKDGELLLPIEQPAHGYAVPVTWSELERIFAVYPDP